MNEDDRCDLCGEALNGDMAEIVPVGDEAVPVEDHLITHAECYLGRRDQYELA